MKEKSNCFPLLRSIFLCIKHIRITLVYSWAVFLLENGLCANRHLAGPWECKDACKSMLSVLWQTKKLLSSMKQDSGKGCLLHVSKNFQVRSILSNLMASLPITCKDRDSPDTISQLYWHTGIFLLKCEDVCCCEESTSYLAVIMGISCLEAGFLLKGTWTHTKEHLRWKW